MLSYKNLRFSFESKSSTNLIQSLGREYSGIDPVYYIVVHILPLGVQVSYFEKFWRVMEFDNTIFQDLKGFGKEKFFKMAMEKFWIFVLENYQLS